MNKIIHDKKRRHTFFRILGTMTLLLVTLTSTTSAANIQVNVQPDCPVFYDDIYLNICATPGGGIVETIVDQYNYGKMNIGINGKATLHIKKQQVGLHRIKLTYILPDETIVKKSSFDVKQSEADCAPHPYNPHTGGDKKGR